MITPTDEQVEAANLYRKKPIVIEARYFDGTHHSADHLIEWMGNTGTYIFPKAKAHDGQLYVGTLEDGAEGEAKHVASKGDWIIKGIAGEFYPIKPEIFADSYEPAALTAAFSLAAQAETVSEPWDGLLDCLDDIREKQAERKGAIWDQIHDAREIVRMRWPRSEEDQKIFDLTNKALYSLGGDPINMDLEQTTKHLRSACAALLPPQPSAEETTDA